MPEQTADTRSLGSWVGAALLRASLLGADAPTVASRYRVSAMLGQGASGVVVRAWDPRLERDVALKLTPQSSATTRMETEARALAKLRRPRHVVQVMEVGSGPLSSTAGSVDVAFVSMEFVPGESLRTWLSTESRSLPEIVHAFECLADGLATTHAQGVVHGDVKPDNAIIGSDGAPLLVDFGFASVVSSEEASTTRSDIVGTGPYLSPEARRGAVTCEADVFAFAVSAWEAVTGVQPFGEAGEPQTTWYGALKQLPLEERVPKPLRKLLRRALHPKLSKRPTAMQMRDRLRAFHATLVGRAARFFRRLFYVIALLCISVVFSCTFALCTAGHR